MSKKDYREAHIILKYNSMTKEELEEILRRDAEGSAEAELSAEELLYLTEVLSSMENGQNKTGKTAQEAWESFEKYYMPVEEETGVAESPKTQKKQRRWPRRLVAAAAAIVLVIFIPLTANALSWEKMWHTIARWANGTFFFGSTENVNPDQPDEAYQEVYFSLQDALRKSGLDASFVPTYIPPGFSLEEIEKDVNPMQQICLATYVNGEKYLRIRVCNYLEADPEYVEVDEDILEIYSAGGVDYYVFNNMDEMHAIWTKDSYQYYISGDISIDEVKDMIDSIGKG